MKHTSKFLFLFSCVLLLASCKDSPEKQLEQMRGEWESVKNRPAFSLFEENGHYRVTTYRKTYRGTIQTETYQISEQDGNLFIETGLSVLLTYDKENDRILLSPGGEYKRSNQPIKK